jgi:hypothetical protein
MTRIRDLPVELQELCDQRREEQRKVGDPDHELSVMLYFSFCDTPEDKIDNSFWYNVYAGRDMSQHRCYPKRTIYEIY